MEPVKMKGGRRSCEMAETISHLGRPMALIILSRFQEPGVHFFTENNLSQQLAYMRHPAGKVIAPHRHNPVPREILYTHEVLFIRKGKLRVDFYDDEHKYLQSRMLEAGDAILLMEGGGHGFEVLEEIEMFEVKQGPFAGDLDKTRFEPNLPAKIVYKSP